MFRSTTCVLLLPAALVLVLGLPSASCAPGHKAPALPHIHGVKNQLSSHNVILLPTAANLPQPPAGSKLLRIALGFGIQNYTCAGALAVLYDITSLYPGQTRDSLPQKDWDHLPSRALWSHDVPLNLEPGGASPTRPFPAEAPLRLRGMRRPLPFLGHHLFTSAGVPNFVLDSVSARANVLCGKMAAVSAPSAADRGPQGTGAVPWLQLGAREGSVGPVKYVYRVLTTGGNSHGRCSSDVAAAQDSSTCYATMYWFFG